MKKYCEGKRHLKANTPKTKKHSKNKKTFQKQKNIPKTKNHSKKQKTFHFKKKPNIIFFSKF